MATNQFQSFAPMGMREPDELSMGMRTRPALYTPRPGAAPATMVPDMAYRPKPGTTPAGAVNVSAPLDLQGVEKRAADALMMQQNQGPMPPMIVNGSMRFTAPAPTPAPAPAPMRDLGEQPVTIISPTRPAPMMMAPAPGNSLSRGAAPMGLGGVAPQAVGRSRYDPSRMAEQMVRRRDPRGFQFLAGRAMQAEGQNFQREMFGAQQGAMNERDATNFEQGLQMFGAQQDAMNQRDATNFQQQQQMFQMQSEQRAGESALEFQRRQEAERADRAAQSIVGGEQLPMQGGFVPMVRRADGSMSMAGGFLPAPKAEAPLPEGMVPTRAMRGGVQYEPAKSAGTGKAPPFTYEKDPNGKITGAVYPVQDPETGAWKLQRADLNGDGVVSPEEAAAVPAGAAAASAASPAPQAGAAPDAKARMNALRKRIGLPEL